LPPPAPPRIVTEDEIRAWMAEPETETRKAWRLGREAKSKELRAARREEFAQANQRVA
jgi:hypothetical protein